MRYLMKFGGTSVADGPSIARTVGIIAEHRRAGHDVAVVVSAMRGVTDGLISCAQEMAVAPDPDPSPFLRAVRGRQESALASVAPEHASWALAAVDERLASLANILQAVHALRELTPRSPMVRRMRRLSSSERESSG
jgi:aspartate kinase